MTDQSTHTPAAPAPAHISQSTAVEQSRAVAEVQAAVIVAQQCPRNHAAARAEMRASCENLQMAERAFFRFPRSGQSVTGITVDLARELARCWGNVQYDIHELSRDETQGVSEVRAWAWDVQTNTRSSRTFIVPHKRDKRGKNPERVTDVRDIYELTANMGARRLRVAITAILPPWFVEEAKAICAATLERGDGRPMPERIDAAVAAFDSIGVSLDRIEQKLGRKRDNWDQYDIAMLTVTYKSLTRGELKADEEFPQQRVTVAEITGAAKQAAPQDPVPDTEGMAGQSGTDEPAPEGTASTGTGAGSTSDDAADPFEGPLDEAELRALLKARKVSVAAAMKFIQADYPDAGLGTISDVSEHAEASAALADWVDQK